MKLSRDSYRRLVLLNTALLVALIGLGLLALVVALGNARVRSLIGSLVDREISRSDTLSALSDGDAPPLDTWGLGIDSKHMRQIEQLAEALVEAGSLTESGKRWFPAELRVADRRHEGKIRLRGDLDQHWRGAKKSWRLRLKRDQFFEGRRDIDLILPRDKGYEVEPVAYAAARELGLIAPDSGFANVTINGVDMGAYFWREVPGKEALEKLGFPEGELIGERNTWIQEFFSGRGIYKIPSPPVSFHPGNWRQKNFADTENAGRFQARWRQLLSLITEADDARFDAEIEDILDLERYLTWNALTWLFGSAHSHWGDNLDWYYDPTSGRFVPLLYDVFRYRIDNRSLGTFEVEEHDDLALRVLRDPGRRLARNRMLWRLVNDPRFDMSARTAEMFEDLAPHLLRGVEAPTRQDVADFRAETVSILDHNRRTIRDHLAFGRLFVAPTVTAVDGRPALVFDLAPDALVPIAIEALRIELADDTELDPGFDPGFSSGFDPGDVLAELVAPDGTESTIEVTANLDGDVVTVDFDGLDLETPVDPNLRPRLGRYLLTVVFPRASLGDWRRPGAIADLDWKTRHPLTESAIGDAHLYQTVPAHGFDPPPVDPPRLDGSEATRVEDRTLPPAARARSRLRAAGIESRLDGEGSYTDGWAIVLDAGRHRLTGDVALPRGVALRLEPGVRLMMDPGATLMVRGPVTAVATAADPIVIDRAVPDRPWGAFGVVDAGRVAPDAVSRFAHVTVRGGSEDWLEGVYLSGQLSLYGAPVEIVDSLIADGAADDGLNVKRARTTIRRTAFVGNFADGFDGDFIEGVIEESCFAGNGGDGLDLSGARVTVRRTDFDSMGDKGISLGERSTALVVDSVFRHSVIGLAVKDLSEGEIVASRFETNRTALALYRKKPIFGGGRATVTRSVVIDNDRDADLDAESSLRLVSVRSSRAIRGPGIEAEDSGVAARVFAVESAPGMNGEGLTVPSGPPGLTAPLELACPRVRGSS